LIGDVAWFRRQIDSALDLEQTLMRYLHLYNTQLPQLALRSQTPMPAMQNWYKSHLHFFGQTPRNCSRHNSQLP